MNELMRRAQIDAAALDQADYFVSLLSAGCSAGVIDDAAIARIQRASTALLAQQTALLTGGKSSSVRTETAQELLSSIFYTFDAALMGCSSPDAALERVLSVPLDALFAEGQAAIRRRVAYARSLHQRTLAALCPVGNVFFRDTVTGGISGFFKLYRPALFAHETHITADYPTFFGEGRVTGIAFIARYLRNISVENRFFSCFAPEDIARLLSGIDEDWRESVMNLYEPLALAAFGAALTGKSARGLDFDIGSLSARLSGCDAEGTAVLMRSKLPALCGELCAGESVQRYIERSIPRLAARMTQILTNQCGYGSIIFVKRE